MKIPGSDGNEKRIGLLKDPRSAEQAGEKRSTSVSKNQGDVTADATSKASGQKDSVTLSSLGTLLRTELDPTKLAEERQKKLDELKKRIQEGTYQPPLRDVARSLSEELSLEILLSDQGGAEQENDNGLL